MEKGARKLYTNDGNRSKGTASESPKIQKEVNSWDRSTPTSNRDIKKGKTSDWDSSSECQETMVVPFDDNENPKDCDNWDSESGEKETKGNVAEGTAAHPFLAGSSDSYDLSLANFSDIAKTSETDTERGSGKTDREDFLLVEDFDEFLRDRTEESPRSTTELGAKVRSNESEGTPEDTTIWMIPKSEHTQSRESTSKLISSSDREKISSLKRLRGFLKKTKSLSHVQKSKIRGRTTRSSRSEYLGYKKNNYSNFLICEGSDLKRKLEIETEKTKANISGCESFDRTGVFFTEYECRTMTMDKDIPEKLSTPSRSVVDVSVEIVPDDVGTVSNENAQSTLERNVKATSVAALSHYAARAGPSDVSFTDVVSLPDMRKSFKDKKMEDGPKKQEKESSETKKPKTVPRDNISECQISESWLLLDDTGQYKEITRHVVSMLLNGRSADAVLQGRKEHFIPNATLRDTASLKNSISCMLTQESPQQVLKEEDLGGEDDRKKIIDLERKVENTLVYIQPGMNHTASVRIIPLDTEMIHIWKRARDGGSAQSLEVDTVNSSVDAVEASSLRSSNGHHSSVIRRPFVEQTVSEEDENQPHNDSTTVNRHMDPVLSKVRDNEVADYSKMLYETRMNVSSLMNNFKILQNRFDTETNQNVALQGDLKQLKKFLANFEGKLVDNSGGSSIGAKRSIQSAPSFLVIKGKTELESESFMEEQSEGNYSKSLFEVQDKTTNTDCMMNTSIQALESAEGKMNEGNDIITVNIYTIESFTPGLTYGKNQEPYGNLQSNLRVAEEKMIRVQKENECVRHQNEELKTKLKEISLELEKHLGTESEQASYPDESRELETLRDQVRSLSRQLEELKMLVRGQKYDNTEENLMIRMESEKSLSLQNWYAIACELLQKIAATKSKLEDNGIVVDLTVENICADNPNMFLNVLMSYIEQTSDYLMRIKNENLLFEKTVREELVSNPPKEVSHLNEVMSGYDKLIEQCRKDQMKGEIENRFMEDYFTVLKEKASLSEEIKIIKTENELLLESHMEHYEKLKQALIALKERKSEIAALESSHKLQEEERIKTMEMLKLYEEKKMELEKDAAERSKTTTELLEEMKKKNLEIADSQQKLSEAANHISNFEQSCRQKEELINELKAENDELLNAEGMKNNQIEILEDEIKSLQTKESCLGHHLGNVILDWTTKLSSINVTQTEKELTETDKNIQTELQPVMDHNYNEKVIGVAATSSEGAEAELTSSKLFFNETQKEMTNYITHLEGLVNNSQESLEKVKQKLKESNQTINRLKSENDVLDKQHQCDLKLFNNTKEELDSCKEKITKLERKLKESEEERERFHIKCESLAGSEKEKSEALEALSKEYKMILEENADLAEKLRIFSKDKDESLKEQKELINKYAMLSKEIQKLQEKYRNVKYECNERTDVIRYLEMMLKENIVEYNNRIACLEQNISRIIEKIVACKDGMREKHFGVDAEVKELRKQLEVTYQEREEMESIVNNYYSLTKHLEKEIQEREKKVDELHTKLSMERQKAVGHENERKSFHVFEPIRSAECLKIEQLENQIIVADRELEECKKQLQCCQTNYENEKKKLELTIVDLKSEVKRYQLRIDVMMKNLSNSSKSTNGFSPDKRSTDESEIQAMKKELQEKNKTITELKNTIDKYKAEVKVKESDLENSNKRGLHQNEELKNLQNQINKMQEVVSNANKTNAVQQKERDEMAEKLFQSIKLIMEERSARQTFESLVAEKEKNFRNQIHQIKNELLLKVKECETVRGELEEKRKLTTKLQDDLKKMKAEVSSLRGQVSNYRKRTIHRGNGDSRLGEEQLLHISTSQTHVRSQNVSPERLESCLKELKDIRDLNLELRKTEGHYQAKIVRLEDEIRDARLLIKELQGDIKTEKKSKKAFKNMIMAAKMEIEKCVLAKQLMSVIAERIGRHLDLSEIPSREFLSGFRLSDSSSSSKCLPE